MTLTETLVRLPWFFFPKENKQKQLLKDFLDHPVTPGPPFHPVPTARSPSAPVAPPALAGANPSAEATGGPRPRSTRAANPPTGRKGWLWAFFACGFPWFSIFVFENVQSVSRFLFAFFLRCEVLLHAFWGWFPALPSWAARVCLFTKSVGCAISWVSQKLIAGCWRWMWYLWDLQIMDGIFDLSMKQSCCIVSVVSPSKSKK